MPYTTKAKLKDGSGEVEVELPEGFLPPDVIKKEYRKNEEVQGLVNRLVEKNTTEAVEKAKKEWLEDPNTRLHFLNAESIPLDKDGKVVLPEGGVSQEELTKRIQESLAYNKTQWEAEHLQPKDKQIEALTSDVDDMRTRMLYAEIAEGARKADVKDERFKPTPGLDEYSAQVYSVASRFQWEPNAKQFALYENGNPVVNPRGNQTRPYIGPSEFWKDLATKDDGFKSGGWFKDPRPSGGPDLGGTGNPGGGGFDPATASDAELAAHLNA